MADRRRYCSVLSIWAAFRALSFIETRERMGARKAVLIFMKHSHYDRTPLCTDLNPNLQISSLIAVASLGKKQQFLNNSRLPLGSSLLSYGWVKIIRYRKKYGCSALLQFSFWWISSAHWTSRYYLLEFNETSFFSICIYYKSAQIYGISHELK